MMCENNTYRFKHVASIKTAKVTNPYKPILLNIDYSRSWILSEKCNDRRVYIYSIISDQYMTLLING